MSPPINYLNGVIESLMIMTLLSLRAKLLRSVIGKEVSVHGAIRSVLAVLSLQTYLLLPPNLQILLSSSDTSDNIQHSENHRNSQAIDAPLNQSRT